MKSLTRTYEKCIRDHLATVRQMVFLVGPRQVGKTTLTQVLQKEYPLNLYLNWDARPDRIKIINDFSAIQNALDLNKVGGPKRLLILDEIHKYPQWQSFVKGIFDKYEKKLTIIVTGSAKLNAYRRGGESMMGRYFLYRIHPLSVAELCGTSALDTDISAPKKISDQTFSNLLKYGGFPEPFTHANNRAYSRWSQLRFQQIFDQDIRDLTNIQELAKLELLAIILKEQAAKTASYSSLGKKVEADNKTVKRWLSTLSDMYYSFGLKPWSKNVVRSLIKESKYFLWDWSAGPDEGSAKENMIACHLLKAVHYWNDIGLGDYDLFYLRDKDKREVDFLVTKDRKPWFLAEVKSSNNGSITPALEYFHLQLKTKHAFQICFDEPFHETDCFTETEPVIVSAQTFLSQLV